jgi:hypothetical protein
MSTKVWKKYNKTKIKPFAVDSTEAANVETVKRFFSHFGNHHRYIRPYEVEANRRSGTVDSLIVQNLLPVVRSSIDKMKHKYELVDEKLQTSDKLCVTD